MLPSARLYFHLIRRNAPCTCAETFRIPEGVAEALAALTVAVVTAAITALSERSDDE